MQSFTYYTPTKVIFGKGTEERTGSLIKEQNAKKVLIHYGGGSVVRTGLLERVKVSLEREGIVYTELGGAVPNPRLSLVYRGIQLVKQEGVDFILAVGGGSAIDSAKAIAYGAAEEEDVWELYDRRREAVASLPVGVVLTFAATGSEMSNSSVITNEEGWKKRSYRNDLARPRFAIMNPELTLTLSDYQTACGCTDILMHTMERYFSNGGSMAITDAIAETLMREVMRNALILKENPQDYSARAEIMWAGSLSHNGLTGCGTDGGDWASHGLEHELGGLYDVAHGAGLAAIWGSWARYVMRDCMHRFYQFAIHVMQIGEGGDEEETALRGIQAMEHFFTSIGMPISLRELGILPTQEELALMAAKCAEGGGGKKGSAKILYEEDLLTIYRMANGDSVSE